jgi:multidrug efflux pump subunit AcrA (membrane-fusion protein)
MTITVPSLQNKSIKAKISTIKPAQSENGLEITASVNEPELKGGEMINVSIKKESGSYDCIIPNAAVHTDESGRKFAYVIKERKTSLGKEYYLQKAFMYVAASDQNETAVESGLSILEKVVTKSDRPVMAGDRVKIHKE